MEKEKKIDLTLRSRNDQQGTEAFKEDGQSVTVACRINYRGKMPVLKYGQEGCMSLPGHQTRDECPRCVCILYKLMLRLLASSHRAVLLHCSRSFLLFASSGPAQHWCYGGASQVPGVFVKFLCIFFVRISI